MKQNINLHSAGFCARLGQIAAAITIIIALFAAASSYAGGIGQVSIGVQFGAGGGGNGGGQALAPTDVAGLPAVSQNNWNVAAGGAGGQNNAIAPLNNNAGSPTVAGVTWASPSLGNTWSSAGNNRFSSVTDSNLMLGYVDNAGTATFTFTNVLAALGVSSYDVYVYADYDTPNRGGSYTIVSATNTAITLKSAVVLNSDTAPTNYVQDPFSGGNNTGNYIVFHGLTNADIQLQALAQNAGTPRAIVNGIQLVASPESADPSAATGAIIVTNGTGSLKVTWTNGPTGDSVLVVMRRGLPVTAIPVDGVTYTGNATFGNGTDLGDAEPGAAHNFVVYAGPTNNVSLTSTQALAVNFLVPQATYFAAVYQYNASGPDYALASPTTASGVAPGIPTNILMTIEQTAPFISTTRRPFTVVAQYDNNTTGDITGIGTPNPLRLTSSNNAIARIISPGRLGLVGPGTVGIVAIYTNSPTRIFTNIQVVTVGSGPVLTYRFDFTEPAGSISVTDSVSMAVGSISNTPTSGVDGAGNLVLDGTAGFVALPGNILTNWGGITVEHWANNAAVGTWARFWDFNVNPTVNIFQTPFATGGGLFRTAATVGGGGAETRVNFAKNADTATLHQWAFTMDGNTGVAAEYVDGLQVGVNTSYTYVPEDMGPLPNMWIGRSAYAADPYYNGSFQGFRIYNGAVGALQIAVDANTGPKSIIGTNALGALTNVTFTVNGLTSITMVQFTIIPALVQAYFANLNGTAVNVTTAGGVYTSSNPNIVSVDPNGNVIAANAGSAFITNSFQTSNTVVSVTVTALAQGMTHRWPFNTDFHDALNAGNPAYDASPHNTVNLDGLGNVTLDGTGAANTDNGSFVGLPPNIIFGYGNIALETWYTDLSGDGDTTGGNPNRNWCRIWDFGSFGGNNLWLSPFAAGLVQTMRVAIDTNNNGEIRLECPRPVTNVEHHVVFVEDITNRTAWIYVDGNLAGLNKGFQQASRDLYLQSNEWLGRSQYGDPLFAGKIDEFRIYNGTLSAVQIGINFITGPNTQVTDPGTASAASFLVNSNLLVGQVVQSTVVATIGSVVGAPVTTAATGWTTTDATIARVDQYGRITACGVGSANITASFRGQTATATITVAAAGPVLLHRYPLDADGTDTIAGSNGTLVGTSAVFANGGLQIWDNLGYMSLPSHLFDTNLEVTFETWLVLSNNTGSGAYMFSFGTNTENAADGGGAGLMHVSAMFSGNGSAYLALRESDNAAVNTPSLNTYHRQAFLTTNQYAISVSDVSRRVTYFINGEQVDSFPYSSQPDDFACANMQIANIMSGKLNQLTEGYLGRSVNDFFNGFRGRIDEFRIYSGVMNKVQARASYLSGPNTPTLDPGAISGLSAQVSDRTMLLGMTQHPTITATFATGNYDVTGLPGVSATSDNTAAVTVVNGRDGDLKLTSVGTGSANIIWTYKGKTATNTVTVIARPTQAVPTHVYSFIHSNALDLIGHGDGSLKGVATFNTTVNTTISNTNTTTGVVLNNTLFPPTYVNLPSDLISGYDLATFEAFYYSQASVNNTQGRMWDFGETLVDNGGITGSGYIYEAAGSRAAGLPGNYPSGPQSTAFFGTGGSSSSANTNVIHVVVTVDSINHIMSIYTNGMQGVYTAAGLDTAGNSAGSVTNDAVDLTRLVNRQSFLGRSSWGDPAYNGKLAEFRLYYGLLTPAQIAASFAAGAGSSWLTITVGPGAGQKTISWPATLTGTLQQSSSLNPQSWSTVGTSPTLVNGYQQVIVTDAGAGDSTVYRLLRQ